MLFVNIEDYILVDYKTNLERNLPEEKEKYYGRRFRENHWTVSWMHDTPWSHDIVQLHFYARLYKVEYNIEIKRMFILHFPSPDPKSVEFYFLPIPDFPYLDEIFNERLEDMKTLGY